MKIKSLSILLVASLFVFGCSSTKKMLVDNPELESMINRKAFEFNAKTVEPQVTTTLAQIGNSGILAPGNSVGRIDVTGSGYFLKMNRDTVSANLPYYGDRQMGGGFGSDAGIVFNGSPKNLKIIKNEEKKSYSINFDVDNGRENYYVTVDLSSNLSSTIHILSSHRNRIRFTGKVKELEGEEGSTR